MEKSIKEITDKEGVVFALKEEGDCRHCHQNEEYFNFILEYFNKLLRSRNLSSQKIAFSAKKEVLAEFLTGIFLSFNLQSESFNRLDIENFDLEKYDPYTLFKNQE